MGAGPMSRKASIDGGPGHALARPGSALHSAAPTDSFRVLLEEVGPLTGTGSASRSAGVPQE